MTSRLREDVRTKLLAVSTATVTTQLFKRGFRQRFLVGVKPVDASASRFVGTARTLRFIPAREDLDTLDSLKRPGNLQWDAIEDTGPGEVLMVDSNRDDRAASAGNILITRLMRRGAAGFVTDGAIRDSPTIAKMGYPVFASAGTASTRLSYFHAADRDVPVGCGGVAVYPGDVVMGDEEGVVVIPADLADEIASAAFDQECLETEILGRIERGEALWGLYPPDLATIETLRAGAAQASEVGANSVGKPTADTDA